jgi:acetylornithine deacetylase/succinyl-diaminopimelate desuccinylase-like protein
VTTGVDAAVAEAVTLASELIALDTTNAGGAAPSVPERVAAEYVAGRLAEVGYEPVYLEPAAGRGNVVARLPGGGGAGGGLLIHGHLDVVPADPTEWTVHPFAGEVRDGYLWGRGALDMKGMLAMTLAVARALRRDGVRPPRDLVFAFLADEEAGGWHGARFLVDHHPGLFDGVTEAIGEVGGFSVDLGHARRAYLVETAEKGAMWLRLTARGPAGHGAMPPAGTAVDALTAALARLAAHRFPTVLTDPVRQLLAGVAELTGQPFDETDPGALVARLGPLARLVGPSLHDTATVTVLRAGQAPNVVPAQAHATVDGRMLPGREAAFAAELAEVLGPDVRLDYDTLPPVHTPFDGPLVAAMAGAVAAEDPGARLLPYLLAASTDAKSFHRLGIRHFGFTPLRLPPELDVTALFHGVDERVPVEALAFGTRVLHRLLSGSDGAARTGLSAARTE